MTLDQKEKFRRILQCLSNGKLEMGRMNLQEALEYFRLAHLRAHEYADFIKINDIDEDPPCLKCANSEPVHTRDFVSGCNEAPAAAAPQSTGRDFSWALRHLKAGNAVRRASWPTERAPMNTPLVTLLRLAPQSKEQCSQFIISRITCEGAEHMIWEPSTGALLADDWELA